MGGVSGVDARVSEAQRLDDVGRRVTRLEEKVAGLLEALAPNIAPCLDVVANALEEEGGERERTVAAVAARVGLDPRTVRFYAREGLVVPAERSGGDYRLYSAEEEEQLRLCAIGREAGLSLDDVRGVLASPHPQAALSVAIHSRAADLFRLVDRVVPS